VKGLPLRVDYDYTADGARRSIEGSLQRLGMGRIDLAFIHDCGEDAHGDRWPEVFQAATEGAAVALTRLREEGVIRGWGLGVNRVEPCVLALERADPDVFLLAGRYSLLDHQPALDALFPRCAERGVRVVVGGPYNSGLIAGGRTFEYREAPPDKVAARDRLAAAAERHGVDLRAAALRFCAAHPVVASVIPGTKSPARVRENVELMGRPIPAAFWEELKRGGVLPEQAPTPPG
jgi:D-threo-aldose 1-dehydrogenase